jgi:hypothetical protein
MRQRLGDFAKNVYSQSGEDGILAAIFERIGAGSRCCIEFGAWDGLHLSNTALLWKSGWRAILIEAAVDRHAALIRNTAGFDCLCLNQLLTPDGEGALEQVLARHGCHGTVDLLSIDVDGDDYHILSGLRTLRPRVLCCEYNPTIPEEMVLVGRRGDGLGCSARALVARADEMGYALVSMTSVNCIFVRREEASSLLTSFETQLEALFPRENLVTLITTFDGRYLLNRKPPYGMTMPHRDGFDEGACFEIRETWLEFAATRLSLLWQRARTSISLRLDRTRRRFAPR